MHKDLSNPSTHSLLWYFFAKVIDQNIFQNKHGGLWMIDGMQSYLNFTVVNSLFRATMVLSY